MASVNSASASGWMRWVTDQRACAPERGILPRGSPALFRSQSPRFGGASRSAKLPRSAGRCRGDARAVDEPGLRADPRTSSGTPRKFDPRSVAWRHDTFLVLLFKARPGIRELRSAQGHPSFEVNGHGFEGQPSFGARTRPNEKRDPPPATSAGAEP